MPHPELLTTGVGLWRQLLSITELSVSDSKKYHALDLCDGDVHPNIHSSLLIGDTSLVNVNTLSAVWPRS